MKKILIGLLMLFSVHGISQDWDSAVRDAIDSTNRYIDTKKLTKLLVDSLEFYDPSQGPGGGGIPNPVDTDIRMDADGAHSIGSGTAQVDTIHAKIAQIYNGANVTGNISVTGTVDGRDPSVDGTKLDGIATGANLYVHPNHSGEVTSTGDGTTVIASGVVDSNNITDGTIVGDDIAAGELEPDQVTETGTTVTWDENNLTSPYSHSIVQSNPSENAGYTFATVTASDVGIWFQFQNISDFNIGFDGSGVTINYLGAVDSLYGGHRLYAVATYTATDEVDLVIQGRPQNDVYIVKLTNYGDDLSTGVKDAWNVPQNITIDSVAASVTTAPAGSAAIIDIHLNGTTIMSTNKISIDDGETHSDEASTQPTLTTTSADWKDIMLFEIDQVGSGTAGTNGTCYVYYTKR